MCVFSPSWSILHIYILNPFRRTREHNCSYNYLNFFISIELLNVGHVLVPWYYSVMFCALYNSLCFLAITPIFALKRLKFIFLWGYKNNHLSVFFPDIYLEFVRKHFGKTLKSFESWKQKHAWKMLKGFGRGQQKYVWKNVEK